MRTITNKRLNSHHHLSTIVSSIKTNQQTRSLTAASSSSTSSPASASCPSCTISAASSTARSANLYDCQNCEASTLCRRQRQDCYIPLRCHCCILQHRRRHRQLCLRCRKMLQHSLPTLQGRCEQSTDPNHSTFLEQTTAGKDTGHTLGSHNVSLACISLKGVGGRRERRTGVLSTPISKVLFLGRHRPTLSLRPLGRFLILLFKPLALSGPCPCSDFLPVCCLDRPDGVVERDVS